MRVMTKLHRVMIGICILTAGCHGRRIWNHHDTAAYQQLSMPVVTQTKSGKAGDPVNVGFIAQPDELIGAFLKAGWEPADEITFRSSVKMVRSVVRKKSYPDAPVSHLYLLGRIEDLAFEQEVNGSARQRHHVRLWLTDVSVRDRPLWLGASTYDSGVFLRKFSHHIAPDVDAERAYLMDTLRRTNAVETITTVDGIGPTDHGRNGEDDPYFTDGRIHIAWLNPLP
jgi:hypothetical protein